MLTGDSVQVREDCLLYPGETGVVHRKMKTLYSVKLDIGKLVAFRPEELVECVK